MLSNAHAGFGGRPEETDQSKDRHRASGRPNRAEGKTNREALRCRKRRLSDVVYRTLRADLAASQQHPTQRHDDTAEEPAHRRQPAVTGTGGGREVGNGTRRTA